MTKRRYFYGKRYSSGDPLVDWIFRRFIQILNERVRKIILKRRLKNDRGALLDGRWDPETGVVELNPARYHPANHQRKDFDVLDAFIHELSHILFEPIKERNILQIEKILCEKLSELQKRVLRRFLPKDRSI